jgi:hypothetical protein
MAETLITIGKYLDVTEAHIAAGLLRSENIPVYPLDIDHLSANPLLGVGLGGVRLQVPARFELEARAILADCELSDQEELNLLATGEASAPDEMRNDPDVPGVFRIRNWVKRKEFWICFATFDIVFIALVLLAIWAR